MNSAWAFGLAGEWMLHHDQAQTSVLTMGPNSFQGNFEIMEDFRLKYAQSWEVVSFRCQCADFPNFMYR